jgi:hypothetical protein
MPPRDYYRAKKSGSFSPSRGSGSSKYSGRHGGSGSAKGSKFKSNKKNIQQNIKDQQDEKRNTGLDDARSAHLKKSAQKSADKYRTGIAELATDEYGRTRNIYDDKGKAILTFKDGKVVRGDEGGVYRDEYGQYRAPGYYPGKIGDKGALLSEYEKMQLAALKMGHLTDLGDPVSRSAYDKGNALSQLISGRDWKGDPIYTGLGNIVKDNWSNLATAYDNPMGYGKGYGQGRMLQEMIQQAGADASYRSSGGGWGSGWGSGYTQSGYGGGGGGGYGYGIQTEDPMAQGYQRGKVGPGSLQEQVNQLYLGSANVPGFNKNRGGIISLLGLK